MHTLFLLSAVLLAGGLGGLAALLARLAPVGARRALALVALATPAFVLIAAAVHLAPRLWLWCAPLEGWDRLATFGLLGLLGGLALGALGLALVRLARVERLLKTCPVLPAAALPVASAELAARLGLAVPTIRLLRTDAPLAVSGGLRRPTVVLSSWLLERLDRRELEAVLGHELAHLARRDHLTRWCGRLLRDATVYLPGGWYALRLLEADQELAADALAVGATGRPLAMAGALGKVWGGAPRPGRSRDLAGLPAYADGSAALLEERFGRLLDGRARGRPPRAGGWLTAAGLASVGGLAPRLLAAGATALPLVCTVRPG